MGGRSLSTIEDAVARIADRVKWPGPPSDLLTALRAGDEQPRGPKSTQALIDLCGLSREAAVLARGKWCSMRNALEGKPTRDDTAPVARDNFGTQIPAEFREAVMLTGQVTKLNKRRAAIEEQIHDLELERSKVDKDLLAYKPLLERMKLLVQAVHEIKGASRV